MGTVHTEGDSMNESITKKDTYVMYKAWSKGILKLTDAQAGQLIKAICSMQNGEDTEPDDIGVAALFEIFKEKMIEDAEAYQAKVERLKKNLEGADKSQKAKSANPKGTQKGTKREPKGEQMEAGAPYTYTYTETYPDTDTVKDKKTKEFKEKYGEFGNVSLTVKEREKLIAKYGRELTEKAIEYLDGYIEDKGYKSKSNYLTIQRWVIDAVKEKERASPKEKFDLDAYLLERIGEED
jgi:hypothetical protein